MKMLPGLLAIGSLATALAATPVLAQDNGATQLPPGCEMLGPELSEETLSAIKDLEQRQQALSCMIGTPRDYAAELAARPQGGEVRVFNLDETWGSDAVAEGLAQSAKAEAATGGELEAAVAGDTGLSTALQNGRYVAADVIGYAVRADGSIDIFVAPRLADRPGVENEEMRDAMEEAVEGETEDGNTAE